MEHSRVFSLFAVLMVCVAIVRGQTPQKEQSLFYAVKDQKATTYFFSDVNQSIRFQPIEDTELEAFISGGIAAIVVSSVIPYVVKKVPMLFYRPEHFIKEYGTTIRYPKTPLTLDAVAKGGSFHMLYLKEGLRTGPGPNVDSLVICGLKFRFDPIQDDTLPGYFAVSLTGYEFEATQVKLKPGHQEINAVVGIVFSYFDAQNHKREFALTPINIQKISPPVAHELEEDGNTDKLQIVPPMTIIESIQISITEVNTRKKDWDKWLELYHENEGKLSNYLLQVLTN